MTALSTCTPSCGKYYKGEASNFMQVCESLGVQVWNE